MTTGIAAYRQQTVETASQGQLIVMLYDGVVTSVDKAETALEARPREVETAHRELTRAQAIIEELLSTLDPSAGDMARSLAELYQYGHKRLVEANILKEIGPAEVVRTMFADLRDAWASISNLGLRESA